MVGSPFSAMEQGCEHAERCSTRPVAPPVVTLGQELLQRDCYRFYTPSRLLRQSGLRPGVVDRSYDSAGQATHLAEEFLVRRVSVHGRRERRHMLRESL